MLVEDEIRYVEPGAAREPWRAMVELALLGGDIVDEAGSGRSVFVGEGVSKAAAHDELVKKVERALAEHGWSKNATISNKQHAELWKWIKEHTAVAGGDPLRASPERDAAASDINRAFGQGSPLTPDETRAYLVVQLTRFIRARFVMREIFWSSVCTLVFVLTGENLRTADSYEDASEILTLVGVPWVRVEHDGESFVEVTETWLGEHGFVEVKGREGAGEFEHPRFGRLE